MKLRGNVVNGVKLLASVMKLNRFIAPLKNARERDDYEKERELIAEVSSRWINDAIEIFDMHLDIKGRENIPDCPCVFIANHQGYADIPALLKALEGHATGFIAKDGFVKTPFLGPWIVRSRGLFIPTDSRDPRESLRIINEGAELLEKGFSLTIFPEGKRSWSSVMDPLKAGSFKLATKAGVPIVPVTIDGTYHMFEDNGCITRGQSASVTIHKPIETAGLSRHEQAELVGLVEETIRSALPNRGFNIGDGSNLQVCGCVEEATAKV